MNTGAPASGPALDARLVRRLYDRSGARQWALSARDFAAALARSAARRFAGAAPAAAEVGRYLESLRLEDLALACACAHGSEPAWERFVRDFRPILLRMASRGQQADRGRDVADSLYAELYGSRARRDEAIALRLLPREEHPRRLAPGGRSAAVGGPRPGVAAVRAVAGGRVGRSSAGRGRQPRNGIRARPAPAAPVRATGARGGDCRPGQPGQAAADSLLHAGHDAGRHRARPRRVRSHGVAQARADARRAAIGDRAAPAGGRSAARVGNRTVLRARAARPGVAVDISDAAGDGGAT